MSGHFPFFSPKKNVSTLNRSLLYIETFSISGRRRTSHRPVMAAHSKRTVSAPIEETRKLAAENKTKKNTRNVWRPVVSDLHLICVHFHLNLLSTARHCVHRSFHGVVSLCRLADCSRFQWPNYPSQVNSFGLIETSGHNSNFNSFQWNSIK